jgi:hypothetical protein
MQPLCAVILLAALTSLACWNVDKLDHIRLDHQTYVYGNPHVNSRITPEAIDHFSAVLAVDSMNFNAKQAIIGDGKIFVSGERYSTGNEMIIEAKDTGCGMSPEVADRIF